MTKRYTPDELKLMKQLSVAKFLIKQTLWMAHRYCENDMYSRPRYKQAVREAILHNVITEEDAVMAEGRYRHESKEPTSKPRRDPGPDCD